MAGKEATVFFDCRGDCGWSVGCNNEEWAVDFITKQIRNHLLYDSRHCGLPRPAPVAGTDRAER